MAQFVSRIVAALLATAALNAQALKIINVSPQGEIARARQIVAKFDEAAVNFGDPKAQSPLSLGCSDAQAAKGSGRWTSERERVFDFDNDLGRKAATRRRRPQVWCKAVSSLTTSWRRRAASGSSRARSKPGLLLIQ